ncbi:MAG: type II secretion system F family protein [Nanoarchaeota archaeon]|nr:type II secretion system F family protein [Nanoarchaeota archaeon]
MFDSLKKNIEQEKKIILDMHSIATSMEADKANKKFYISSLQSLAQQLQLLNKTVPELLKEWSPLKKFIEGEKNTSPVEIKREVKKVQKPNVVKMSYVSPLTKEKQFVTINKGDRKTFLEKLKMSESGLSGLKNMEKTKATAMAVIKPSIFAKYSNRFFLNYSEKLAPNFPSLEKDLKRSNMRFMLKTYLSMAMLSSLLAFIGGFLIYGLMVVMNLSNLVHIWIPFFAAAGVMFAFYTYPASEASSVKKKISQELPFVTIHMAAIAGSNIEPTKIFRIIAASKEYPTIGTEVRKIVSQIEIYGYDLVTSLKNVAARTSSKELSELLSGLATNISGGGELKTYLEKKAENFLMDYKLERQKYADLAGTFMDVYISILIAAPLVLMMMFIVMNVAGLGMGAMSITTLLFLSVAGIAVANIVFLVVLNIKQPVV